MRGKQGGISIMLAIVFVSLLVFCMSIVEVTRYQILSMQARRAVISATQSVLAGYDSTLKDQYGIFARNPAYGDVSFVMPSKPKDLPSLMTMDLRYYLNMNLTHDPETLHQSLVDQYVFAKPIKQNVLYKMSLEDVAIKNQTRLIDGVNKDLTYVKKEMMDYTTLRLPLMALEPILETFGAAEKLGRTSVFLKDKNDQVKSAASIESLYLDLYAIIDGIIIDQESATMLMNDRGFVNNYRLNTDNPNNHISDLVEVSQPIDVHQSLVNYISDVNSLKIHVSGMTKDYDKHVDLSKSLQALSRDMQTIAEEQTLIEQEILACELAVTELEVALESAKVDEVDQINAAIETIKESQISYQDELAYLRSESLQLYKKRDRNESSLMAIEEGWSNQMEDLNLDYISILSEIELLKLIYHSDNSLLELTGKAIEIVDQIQAMGEALGENIDVFIDESGQDEQEILSSTYDQAINDLEVLKSQYGDASQEHFDANGNLTYMNSVLQRNKEILLSKQEEVTFIIENYKLMMVKALKSELANAETWAYIANHSHKSDLQLYQGTWPIYDEVFVGQDVEVLINTIQSSFADYEAITQMDYSGYIKGGELSKGGKYNRLIQLFDKLKSLVKELDIEATIGGFAPLNIQLPEGLPSSYYEINSDLVAGIAQINMDQSDYEGEDPSPNDDALYMASVLETANLSKVASEVKEQLLINEYAIGMFRSYPDKYKEDEETLSGYLKQDHPYETELEYIYTGLTNSQDALRNVAMKIFGLRVAFNVVHLATSPSKRATIQSIATLVAGWWTFGAGTILLGLFIGLIWATIESIIDLQVLLRGDKVALFKTETSWYTSPAAIIDETASLAIDVGTQIIVKSIHHVSEETKSAVKKLSDSLGGELEVYANKEIEAVYDQVVVVADQGVEAFDQVFYKAIDTLLLNYKEGSEVVADRYLNEGPSNTLLNKVLNEIKAQIKLTMDEQGDCTYTELVEIRTEVIEQYYEEIDKMKATVRKQVKDKLEGGIQSAVNSLNEEIDTMASKGETISKDILQKRIKDLSKGMEDKLSELDLPAGDKKKGFDVTMLIPSVDYEMYLRLFMMIDYKGLDDRVLRMLDLIDYNMTYQALNPKDSPEDKIDYHKANKVTEKDLSLMTYVHEFEVEAKVDFNYFFINLPIKSIKSPDHDGYRVIVKAVNGYE